MGKIIFYEWSDINRQPISFDSKENFIDFCNNSNIEVNKKNYNFLNDNQTVYTTCKKGRRQLIMSGDYRNFRKNYSKHRNNN